MKVTDHKNLKLPV